MKLGKLIFRAIIIVILLLILAGFMMNRISNNMCENECGKINALAHEIYPSGDFFKLNDICACIFNDRIKAFKLG